MRKIISLLSAFAILFSSIYVGIATINVFAQSNELLISDCETLTGWTKTGGNALAMNANGFTGSAVSCNIDRGAFRTATYTAATPLDISAYKNIQWDVMMHTGAQPGMWDDIEQYYGDEVYVKIGSSATDYNVYRLSKMTVEQDTGNSLWYHFSIDIDNPSSTTGSFDMTKMTIFYFSTIDGSVNTNVRNGHIRIDNIYARNIKTPVPEEVEDIVLSECESLDNWSYVNNNMSVNNNGMTNKAIHIDTGYSALRKLTFTKNFDLSDYNTLEFDLFCFKNGDTLYHMWNDVTASYSDKIAVEVSDGTNVNIYGLDKWNVTSVSNLWHHVVINLKDATSDSKKLDLSKFASFSIYTNTTGSLDNTLPNTSFRIDNLVAHYDKNATTPEPPVDTDGIWEMTGSFEKTTTGTFSYVNNNFEFDLSAYQKADLYLTMKIFIENKDGTDNVNDFTSEGQIELTSSGESDKQEVNWSVPKLGLKSGWNDIRLSLSNTDFDNGLNLANVNYFRFYSKKAGDAEFNVKIQDLAITNIKEESIVSSYFSDGMMFRQNKPMNVFGKVKAADLKITSKLKDANGVLEEKETTSAEDGSWSLSFSGRNGGYNAYSIEIYVNDVLTKTINNILIGELWLAAGQSNMEFFVLQTIPDYDYDLIPLNQYVRFFDEPLVPGGVNSRLPSSPASDIEGAKWADGSNSVDVRYISAIAYYMSLQLQTELNVPVGFINAAKGASVIESWLPREIVENDSVIKGTLEERGIYKTAEQLDKTDANWTYLTTLYNTKIAPLAGVEISGMLWYQGESNIKYADDNGYNTFYKNSLEGLIESYSKLFGYKDGNMPFVCAHLAPYNYNSIRADYATVLASFSEMLSDVTANTTAKMIQIPIYDLPLNYVDPPINNPDPIHPNSKSQVATRFANAVLSGVYGVGDETAANAPVAKSYKVNGNRIEITFKNVGTGLNVIGGADTLHGFAICSSDRVFVKAEAEIISADTVAVYSDKVTSPVAATYAWSSFNMGSNLCNSAGVPAVPYRTDKTESVYYLSMDWGYCDSEYTWDAKITLDAGYKPTYSASSNAAISFITDDKLEGDAAVKLNYTADESKIAFISPILNYSGMVNNYPNYSGMTLNVKNTDDRSKKLSVEIIAAGERYKATVTTGDVLATEYDVTNGDYKEYTFNFDRIVNSEGKVLRDSTTVLKTLTAINIIIGDDANGTMLLDNIYLRADTLPTPGAENDELIDGVVDTTPGSLDTDGNMWLSDADSESGWHATGATLTVDNANKTQGKGSVGATAVGGNLKEISFTSTEHLDISEYDYFEFDIYFSNMKWFNACESMMFELTSSGGPDNESDRYMKGYLSNNQLEFYDAAVSGTEIGAWYHVKLILGSPQTQARGGMNNKGFNFFRFFAVGSPAGTPDFEVKLDNLKFTKEPNGEVEGATDLSYGKVIDENSMWMTDADSAAFWSATGSEAVIDTTEKAQGAASISAVGKKGVLRQIAFAPKKAIDISEYDYLEFDVYFSNMEWFNACESMMFELTSSDGPDNESNRYMKGYLSNNEPEFYEAASNGTNDGAWYHIKLILGAPQTQARGGLNNKNFNFFRFFTTGSPDTTSDFTVKFDNMKFTKDPSGEATGATDPSYGKVIDDTSMWMTDADSAACWSATGSEVVLDTTEKKQGSASVSAVGKKGVLRQIAFAPKKAIDISEYDYLEFDVYFSNLEWFNACESMMFELTSSDGPDNESSRYMKGYLRDNETTFYAAAETGESKAAWYHIKLIINSPQTEARGGLDETKFNFFRFFVTGSPNTTSDFTVKFDNMKFTKDPSGEAAGATDPSYGKVIDDNSMWMTDGDSLVFWNATGTEVKLDTANKTQGNSAVTVTAEKGILKQIAFVPKSAIDISQYSYLEFDIYFSNLDWFSKCKGTMFELTSAGTCDKESNRYTKSSMLEASPAFAADVESGNGGGKWYHFKFNLDRPHTSVKGGLDKTAFDYFRFYSVELEDGAETYTMLLDNMKFVKGEKAAEIVKTDEYLIINNGDSAAGWSSPGQEVMFDSNNKTEGNGSVSVIAKNGILKELAYRPAEPIDISAYSYLKFDLFLSDITCLNSSTGFMVELTSSGTCDDASNRYMKSAILVACPELAADLANGAKGNKWYSFCFNLSKPQNQVKGGLDMKAFNYFRIYFLGSPEGTPDCTVNIDNLRVTVDGISKENQSAGPNQVINFGSGSNTNYQNIGNKTNGGLLAAALTPAPTGLVITVAAMGGALILLLVAIVVVVIFSYKKRKLG